MDLKLVTDSILIWGDLAALTIYYCKMGMALTLELDELNEFWVSLEPPTEIKEVLSSQLVSVRSSFSLGSEISDDGLRTLGLAAKS